MARSRSVPRAAARAMGSEILRDTAGKDGGAAEGTLRIVVAGQNDAAVAPVFALETGVAGPFPMLAPELTASPSCRTATGTGISVWSGKGPVPFARSGMSAMPAPRAKSGTPAPTLCAVPGRGPGCRASRWSESQTIAITRSSSAVRLASASCRSMRAFGSHGRWRLGKRCRSRAAALPRLPSQDLSRLRPACGNRTALIGRCFSSPSPAAVGRGTTKASERGCSSLSAPRVSATSRRGTRPRGCRPARPSRCGSRRSAGAAGPPVVM